MKIRTIGTLGALVLTAGLVAAQTTPPIKMGLWKITETTKMSGFSLPPQAAAELKQMGRSLPGQTPHTAVYESCWTKAQWQKDLVGAPHKKDCSVTNRKISTSEISTDVTCKFGNYVTSGSWDVHILDREHTHGVGQMKSTSTASGKQGMSTNTTFDSQFISASCGDVQPGKHKLLKHN